MAIFTYRNMTDRDLLKCNYLVRSNPGFKRITRREHEGEDEVKGVSGETLDAGP